MVLQEAALLHFLRRPLRFPWWAWGRKSHGSGHFAAPSHCSGPLILTSSACESILSLTRSRSDGDSNRVIFSQEVLQGRLTEHRIWRSSMCCRRVADRSGQSRSSAPKGSRHVIQSDMNLTGCFPWLPRRPWR